MLQVVVSAVHIFPAHPRVARGVVLSHRYDSRKLGSEPVHDQVDLQLAERRHVFQGVFHARFQDRNGLRGHLLRHLLHFLLELADECGMFLEDLAVLRADRRLEFFEVLLQMIQDTRQVLPMFRHRIESMKHLVWTVDRCHWLVWSGVTHSSPGVARRGRRFRIRANRSESAFPVLLQNCFQLLIDEMPRDHPADVRAPTQDVPRKKFDTRQQASDPSHVLVAIAANLVADPAQEQRLVFEWLQWLSAFPKREVFAFFLGPECLRDDSVRTEHDHEPLLSLLLVCQTDSWQVEQKRNRRGAQSHVRHEFASRSGMFHRVSRFYLDSLGFVAPTAAVTPISTNNFRR